MPEEGGGGGFPFAAAAAGIGQTIASAVGRRRGRRFAKKEAEKNRRFQAQQSGSIYQRGVKDMRAAGINPILMSSGGFGASAASGGMQSPTDQSIDVAGGVSTAASAAMMGINLRNAKAQGNLIRQQEDTSWYLGNEAYHRGRANLGAARKGEILRDFYNSADGAALARRAEYFKVYGPSASAAAGVIPKLIPGPAGARALKAIFR